MKIATHLRLGSCVLLGLLAAAPAFGQVGPNLITNGDFSADAYNVGGAAAWPNWPFYFGDGSPGQNPTSAASSWSGPSGINGIPFPIGPYSYPNPFGPNNDTAYTDPVNGVIGSNAPASNGDAINNFLFIQGTGTASQTFTTTPGDVYIVSVDAAERATTQTTAIISVGDGSNTTGLTSLNTGNLNSNNFFNYLTPFQAGPSGSSTIGLTNTGVNGGDNTADFTNVKVQDITSVANVWSGTTSNNLGGSDVNFAAGNLTAAQAQGYGAGTLQFNDTNGNGGSVTNSSLVVQPGAITSGTLAFNNSAVNYTLSNTAGDTSGVTGAASITKAGSGTLTILSPQSYSGPTVVSGGTLAAGGGLGDGTFTGYNINGGYSYLAAGQLGVSPPGLGWFTNTNLASDNAGLGPALVGSGNGPWGYSPTPAGQLISVQRDSNVNENLALQAGTYTLNFYLQNRPSDGGAVNPINVLVDGSQVGATLTPNAFAGWTQYSETFTVTSGEHTLTFAGTQSGGDVSTGLSDVTLTATGPVAANNLLSPNSQAQLTSSGALLDIAGTQQSIGSLSGVAGSTVALGGGTLTVGNDGTNATYAGTISDAGGLSSGTGGSLVKIGSGVQTLTGNNTYSGGTTISGGTLYAGSTGALGSGNVQLDNNTTLGLNYTGSTSNNINLVGGNQTIFVGGPTNGASPTLTGNITSDGTAGTLTIGSQLNNGATLLTLTGNLQLGQQNFAVQGGNVNNEGDSYNSQTYLNGATLTTAGNVQIGRGSLVVNGGSLSANQITNSATSGDWSIFQMQNGANVTATNGINLVNGAAGTAIASSLYLNGGTLTTPSIVGNGGGNYFGTHTEFSGVTVVASASNSDFLQVYADGGGGYAPHGGYGEIGTNGLTFNTNGNNVGIQVPLNNYGGQTGALTVDGPGTLTLSAANGYTGNTTVNGGLLNVTGSLANNGSNNVIVQSGGATFGGAGSSTGGEIDRAIASGGTYAGYGSQDTGTGTNGTHADILAGTATLGAGSVDMSWRNIASGETVGSATNPPFNGGGSPTDFGLLSDVLNLHGLATSGGAGTATDPFELSVTYNSALIPTPLQSAAVDSNLVRLDWLNPTTGLWAHATTGDFATGGSAVTGYQGTFAQFETQYGVNSGDLANFLGSWGTGGGTAWAIVDHNSSFAVAVPEPSTLVLMVFGSLGLWLMGRRRDA